MTGHVTKDGDLAGPRALEHAVDVVLMFEGDPRSGLRVLSGGKNRFGAEGETAWFEMDADGLHEIDPRACSSRASACPARPSRSPWPGRRALAVEVQALVGSVRRARPPAGDRARRSPVPADGGRARARRRLPPRARRAVRRLLGRHPGRRSGCRPRRRGRARLGRHGRRPAGRSRVRRARSPSRGSCGRPPACRSGWPPPRPPDVDTSSPPRGRRASAASAAGPGSRSCRRRSPGRRPRRGDPSQGVVSDPSGVRPSPSDSARTYE